MEKLAKNNQYNHYCEKCQGWKLHARGPKYYRCLTCNTKTARGLTPVAADALCDCYISVPAGNYPDLCAHCGKKARR